MSTRLGLVWDQKIVFSRYIEDCGIACEHVTPHMLAAPFFRGRFNTLVVPTGFGNPAFSNLLPALRAATPRINRFLESGGRLLVFGAASENITAYDWLPFQLTYHHSYGTRRIEVDSSHVASAFLSDYDLEAVECDGHFTRFEGEAIARAEGFPVMIEKEIGEGAVIATTIHEYPSRNFIKEFCCATGEILF